MRAATALVPLLLFSACTALSGASDLETSTGSADASDDMAIAPGADATSPTDAGIDESDASIDAPPSVVCPTKGGGMVRLGAFCVDALEVTIGAYNAFLEADDKPAQTEACTWNTSFESSSNLSGVAKPISGVDWCDAQTFCTWAGKHLCGSIEATTDGAHALAAESVARSGVDARYTACTASGTQNWPYGATFVQGNCNTAAGMGDSKLEPSNERRTCEGGRLGLFAMVGNVWEWIDACEPGGPAAPPSTATCHFAGGSVQSAADVQCGAVSGSQRDFRAYDVGFRCCY